MGKANQGEKGKQLKALRNEKLKNRGRHKGGCKP